jgi:hypothetical protein
MTRSSRFQSQLKNPPIVSQKKEIAVINDTSTKLNIKIPREVVYQSFTQQPGTCPKCGGTLVQEYQHYVVNTYENNLEMDSFYMGEKFGWFCKSCPVVVINISELRESLHIVPSNWEVGSNIIVLGILDLDAIPEKKRNIPLGTHGNQVPLIKFSNLPTTIR